MTFRASGNSFVSANATTFSNVFVTGGTVRVGDLSTFQGTVAGYQSGGQLISPGVQQNIIDKWPFSTDANASDVGDLTVARFVAAGQSSSESGYTSGGEPIAGYYNTIDKFPFASNGNATDVGDLTRTTAWLAGQSSTTNGYSSGGGTASPAVANNIVDTFPFASNGNATDVGDLTVVRYQVTGQSSLTHGYTTGGIVPPALGGTGVNTIDKFPFASNGNATDVGDLASARANDSGQSSYTHGYVSARSPTTPVSRFPFSTDSGSTNVGSLITSPTFGTYGAGQSSTTHGYDSNAPANNIQKFSFSNFSTASAVGSLTQARRKGAGQQD